MAPLEDSSGIARLAEPRPIDSLMRALLYVVQQVGRPLDVIRKSLGDATQAIVSGRMANGIVEQLEAIDIEHQQR